MTNRKGSPGSGRSAPRRQFTHPHRMSTRLTSTLAPLTSALGSALHHVLPITGGVGLLWPRLTSAQSLQKLPPEALSRDHTLADLSGSHWFVTRYRAQPFPCIAGTWSAGSPIRHFHWPDQVLSFDGPVGQISPDKNVNCHDATAAFTVSPEPGALSCRADLPRDSALYAVSVRRLITLHSGFLRTVPRGSALAFG